MLVDALCYLGDCRVFDRSISESDLMSALDANGVTAAIVRPFPGAAPDPSTIHDRIADLAAKNPGRIFGVVSVNPHVDRELYHGEVERCVREMGFVGVEMHTSGQSVNPQSQDGQTVFEAAREFGVPVMVNTGTGAPFSMPLFCLPRARDYGDVKIVLANAGGFGFAAQALLLAREAPNVFVETSWCSGDEIRRLVDELGANRVMMGSETPTNLPVELAKYRSVGLYEFQIQQSTGQTAVDVFGLKGVATG